MHKADSKAEATSPLGACLTAGSEVTGANRKTCPHPISNRACSSRDNRKQRNSNGKLRRPSNKSRNRFNISKPAQ